jgi:hypothetical protein
MRQASLSEIGVRWYYWLIAIAFGLAGIGGLAAVRIEPESRSTLIACGTFFCIMSVLSLLWPVMRIREQQGPRMVGTRLERMELRGILMPISRVKLYIGLIGASAFGSFGILATVFAESAEDRLKGGMGAIFFFAFVFLCLKNGIRREMGILLTSQGVVWQDILMRPIFLPWEHITAAAIYAHKDKYHTHPSLGLRLKDMRLLALAGRMEKKLAGHAARFGFHLSVNAESLLVPLETATSGVWFYLKNCEKRSELLTEAGLERICGFDDSSSMTRAPRQEQYLIKR